MPDSSFTTRNLIFPCLITLFIFIGCENGQNIHEYTQIDAPAEIAMRAFNFAQLYEQAETEYQWGGQDPVRSAIAIDCSGLIIMSYKYALVDTKYQLLQQDMTANYMYQNACTVKQKEQCRKGDLIFMGEAESNKVTHIAILEKIEGGWVHFIDSTEKDLNGDGVYDINGVSRRQYQTDDARLKAFGTMKLKY